MNEQEQETRRRPSLRKTLRRLLDSLRPPARVEALPAPTTAAALPAPPTNPRELMLDLLVRAEVQTREQAEAEFFAAVLRTFVPDQIRILSALSDGSGYPLIHIFAGPRFGAATRPVLECVSSVGRSAGVICPEFTHQYVQLLRQHGLVEIEATESDQGVKYELLETETVVRSTLAGLKQQHQRHRIVRGTLKISALGAQLWRSYGPNADAEQ